MRSDLEECTTTMEESNLCLIAEKTEHQDATVRIEQFEEWFEISREI